MTHEQRIQQQRFGVLVRTLRRSVNETGTALARRCGMTQLRLSRIECGVVRVKPSEVKSLVGALPILSTILNSHSHREPAPASGTVDGNVQ
jgi:transcriptional regulator with XRE-family HTH domain